MVYYGRYLGKDNEQGVRAMRRRRCKRVSTVMAKAQETYTVTLDVAQSLVLLRCVEGALPVAITAAWKAMPLVDATQQVTLTMTASTLQTVIGQLTGNAHRLAIADALRTQRDAVAGLPADTTVGMDTCLSIAINPLI